MSLKDKRVAVLAATGFEDQELVRPVEALRDSGAAVTLIGLTAADKKGIKGKKGTIVPADKVIDEVDQSDFDLLVIPGGKAPSRLRENGKVLDLVRDFDREGKTIAAICHGPQVLASADILKGRTATSYFTVAREVKKAGGDFVNKAVVVDGNLITSRQPGDIPRFIDAILSRLRDKAAARE